MSVSKPQARSFVNAYSIQTVKPDGLTKYATTSEKSWIDTRSDSSNPTWRDQVASHHQAGTPLSGSRKGIKGRTLGYYRTEYQRLNKSATSDRTIYTSRGDILDGFDLRDFNSYTNPTLEAQVSNEALTKFYKQLWGAIRSLEGGVFLGEVKETLSMIRNPAKTFRNTIDSYSADVRRRYRKGIRSGGRYIPRHRRSGQKILADTWLEYVFGWAPLLNDIKDGAEALARLANDPNDYQRVRVQSEGRVDMWNSIPRSSQSYWKNLNGTQCRCLVTNARFEGSISVRYLGEVRVNVDRPLLMARDLLGFNLNDFVPTVWELIPYSFLVDYFTNIGDVISAWSFPSGRLAWHNRSVVRRTTQVVTAQPLAPNEYITNMKRQSWSGSSHSVEWFASSFNRSQGALGYPKIALELPNSSIKWLNIGALIRSKSL